jgi:hypothetical protein
MRSLSKCSFAALMLCGGVFADAPAGSGVDIAWKVLPRRVVADNFGARIAKLYFAVQAVVGNSSGYDIQVSSIFFRMPDSAGLSAPVPTDPYNIVRGTLDREHLVGMRNTSIHVIEAVGPVLAGGAVFFAGNTAASLHHGLIYSRIINVFTGPFAKGFELVLPDKTLNQMVALDNQAMRDSALISNGSQHGLLVFVSRDLLMRPRDGSADAKARRRGLRRGFRNDFDPMVVMRELGEMVLVGKSVQYVNRINVTAGAGKNPVRPGPAMNGAAEAQGSAPCRVQIEPETLENQKP